MTTVLHVLLLTDRGLEVEPAPDSVHEFDGGRIYVPFGIDVDPILKRVVLWHRTFHEMIAFPQLRPVEILVTVDPRAIGSGAGRDDTIGYPVVWAMHERWQRNVWHLTHEVSEFHLKDLCAPPRWFVEGFAQVCAFDLLGRVPGGDPMHEARTHYGDGFARPDTFFSWEHARADSVADLEAYVKNVHFKDNTRVLYASALWLFVNAHVPPDAALKFAIKARGIPQAEWRERFCAEFDLPGDATPLLRAPVPDVE